MKTRTLVSFSRLGGTSEAGRGGRYAVAPGSGRSGTHKQTDTRTDKMMRAQYDVGYMEAEGANEEVFVTRT